MDVVPVDAVLPKQLTYFHPYLLTSVSVWTACLKETGDGAVLFFCVLFIGTAGSFCGPAYDGQEIFSKLYLMYCSCAMGA